MKYNEAIILAGGLGTRLKDVVSDVPKAMAPVADKPFLHYIMLYLKAYGIKRVVLSVGYKYEVIKSYFGDAYEGIELVYAVEEEPLGTGGGIANALQYLREEAVFLINGDTFFNVDLLALQQTFNDQHADLCFSLKPLTNFNRYGEVEVDGKLIAGFREKRPVKQGLINGGVYLFRKTIFNNTSLSGKFSFEEDYLSVFKDKHRFSFIISDTYFIDIGIPKDYRRADEEIPGMFKNKT